MPNPARPVSRVAEVIPGAFPLRWLYTDALGSPLSGTVRITGRNGAEVGTHKVIPAPFSVALADGWLDVNLPPDTYRLEANLVAQDGTKVSDATTVIHEIPVPDDEA